MDKNTKKPSKKIILTGDRPTGRLHVGHYVGSLAERVKLQNGGEFDDNGVMVEPFAIFVGGKVQPKDKGKSPYRSVKIVG